MWHSKSKKQVLEDLKTSLDGLSSQDIQERREKHGLNVIKEEKKKGPIMIFLQQFTNFLTILLIVAAIISYFVGESLDTIAIMVIVVINGFFGFFQEYKAEKAIEALKSLSTPSCKVIRDGQEKIISSNEIVPGDLIILEEGDRIPADAYIIEAMSLQTDESMLTGESIPVKKRENVLPEKTPMPERCNILFTGTVVTYGRGKAIVFATGMETEFGKIAKMVQVSDEKTPLQKRMEHIGKILGAVALAICSIVFFIGVLEYVDLFESFQLAVSLAVSAVPEGLPATITLALTLGVQRLARRKALIRKLSSVETLGAVDYICTDKTGTITKNEITVKKIFMNNKTLDVTGTGYHPSGEFLENGQPVDPSKDEQLEMLIKTARLCNDAHLVKQEKWSVIGDPTEGALLVLSAKAGMSKIDKYYPRVKEMFFDSNRKRMSTMNKSQDGKKYVFVKGAAESLLSISSKVMADGKIKKMTSRMKSQIMETNNKMASEALRILGFAYKEYSKGEMEENLIFLGLVGMIDPPRDEVKSALEISKKAGINVMMITGDHKITAVAIAKQVGLYSEGSTVLTEDEIERMSDEELDLKIENVSVCARISPKSKSRIVESLKRKGHIVAVTGDGINDAPALKRADIGVAVGSGTDVTKQASDMVLVDDNFATIVGAVEEGRNIFDNIKKFIRFLLSANFDEIFVVTAAFMLRLPAPFIPLQLLWLNIMTDGLPALALGAEPRDPNVMYSKPRNPKENVLKTMISYSIFAGVIAFLIEATLFFDELAVASLDYSRTLIFTTSVVFEMILVFSVRTEKFFWQAPVNKYLVVAVLISLFMQVLGIYLPIFQRVLGTVPLSLQDWGLIISACFGGVMLIEVFKALQQKLVKSGS
jgi:Ca2+-transporting ATPase